MKKRIAKTGILMLCLFIPYMLMAQLDTTISLWTNYKGFVITQQHDTIYGYIRLNNLVDNQHKALFFKEKNDDNPTEKYKPKDILAYKVGPRYYESFKYKPTGEANKKHFFLQVISGPIDVYKWFYEPTSRTEERVQIDEDNVMNSNIDLSFDEADLSSITIAVKNDEIPENLTATKYLINFKKHMSKLVEEDKGLAKKIKNKEEGYGLANQLDIIRMYNEHQNSDRNQ